ncbi:hypothetical protein RCL1_008117 [Eukaryota sp. TZLM3-RCL]
MIHAKTNCNLVSSLNVLDALYYLHNTPLGPRQVSYAHRDIKSGNIMVTLTGEFALGDFGLCNEATNAGMFQTLNVASPLYKSPDFLQFQWGYNPTYCGYALDYWSLGVLLYEAATGTFPFLPFPQEIRLPQVQQVLHDLILSGSYDETLVEDVELRAVIRMLLDPNPEQRRKTFVLCITNICSSYFISCVYHKTYILMFLCVSQMFLCQL